MNTLLSAFARRGRWLAARSLLDDMFLQEAGYFLTSPVTTGCCVRPVDRQQAIPVGALDVKVKQDIISFSCVITACEKGNAWEFAMQLLESMQVVKVQLLVRHGDKSEWDTTTAWNC